MAIQLPSDKGTSTQQPAIKWSAGEDGMTCEQDWRQTFIIEAACRVAEADLFHVYTRLSRLDPEEAKWLQDELQSALLGAVNAAWAVSEGFRAISACPERNTTRSWEARLQLGVETAQRALGDNGHWLDRLGNVSEIARFQAINSRLLNSFNNMDEEE